LEAKVEIKANVDSVFVGRVLAGLVIVVGLMVAIWAGVDAQRDGFWVFLQRMITPLSFGSVLIVLSEGLKRLGSPNEEEDGDGSEETL
jgi:hypothetical protein